MKRIFTTLLGATLALTVAVPAMAKEHGRGRERHERNERHETNYRAYRHARFNDHDRDDRRGWDKGRKTGWRGDDMPPGQAKKYRHHDRDDWARRHHRRHRRDADYRRGSYPSGSYGRGGSPVVIPTRPRPTPQPTQAGRGPIPVPNGTAGTRKPSGHGPIVIPQ